MQHHLKWLRGQTLDEHDGRYRSAAFRDIFGLIRLKLVSSCSGRCILILVVGETVNKLTKYYSDGALFVNVVCT